MDRVSSLPNLVLSNILSRLPIDSAIQSRFLGKQWRNIWFPTRDELVFHQTSQRTELYLKEIAQFIRSTMPLDTFPKITKFKLKLTLFDKSFSKDLFHLVLKFAIARHVKDVVLDLPGNHDMWYLHLYQMRNTYKLYQVLRSYASLETLTLRHIDIDSSLKFRWTSLKALTISSVWIENSSIINIFEGCPKLDRFELNECYGFTHIRVGSTSCLRKLIIFQGKWPWHNECKIFISIPKVECLVLKVFERLQLLDISSLVDVSIDVYSLEYDTYFNFYKEYKCKNHLESDWWFHDGFGWKCLLDRQDMLMELLIKVAHIETIRLGTWCLEALSWYMLRGLVSLIPSIQCKYLAVETPVEEWDIPGMVGLLRSSPNLETLVMDLTTGDDYNSKLSTGTKVADTDADIYWNKQKEIFTNFKHLKTVTIVGLSVRLVDFVNFLLENAKSLEKMKLTRTRTKKDRLLIIERILRLPRASPNAQISIC